MLLDVLTRLASDTGLNIVSKRSTLLELLNTSAKELHNKLECNKIYRETTLVVMPDAVVSLPAFIGELRGMRMHTNELPFDLHSLGQPRYVTTTLGYKFKNWRDLGDSPVSFLPSLVGPLTLTAGGIESTPAIVTIAGQTSTANHIDEAVILSASPKLTINLFGPQIYDITCPTNRTFDITIQDGNSNVLAVLYNNFKKTRYKIVDVSQIFWTLDTAAGESLIDVLYKLPKVNLYRDSDSFYAGDDYDEAWYNMAMHFYLKPIQNRQQDSQTFFSLAMQTIQDAKDSSESGIIKKLSFGRNKFFGMFKRYRYYPGSITNVDHNVGN